MSARAAMFSVWLLLAAPAAASSVTDDPIPWRPWSDDLFETASAEGKMVLLDLEAVWCHGCHGMTGTTYEDPRVVELLRTHYIPVRVDQDARPDLSARYEEWGWPATVIFSPDGAELVKRRGYIPPENMASLLQAVVDDPTPGPSVLPEPPVAPGPSFLDDAAEAKVLEEHLALYDREFGGWGKAHKRIDAAQLELASVRALAGDVDARARARRTLKEALQLRDPVWGGFYRYSDRRDWRGPHFEKIMSVQASYARLYAFAHAAWGDPAFRAAALSTFSYVERFWTSPEGGFYTSQDADVDASMDGAAFYSLDEQGRQALGRFPRVDTNEYARENGWMISGLAAVADHTGKEEALFAAMRAAQRMIETRSTGDGGFRHGARDEAGPYLGDTLAMGQAFLDLYESTADRRWLDRSLAAAEFTLARFADPEGAGFRTAADAAGATGVLAAPVRQLEENVAAARWMNALHRYTGRKELREGAERAMRFLASQAVLGHKRSLAGVWLADRELASEPLHVTVVGRKDDAAALALHRAARRLPALHRRIEWWDRREGPLPHADFDYPDLGEAAAFICSEGIRSPPFTTPEALEKGVARLTAPERSGGTDA